MTDWLRTIEHDDGMNSADIAVSPESSLPSNLFVFPIAHADHATETLVYKTTRKIEIVDITVLKSGAGAANTVQLTDSTDAAISDAIVAAVDKAVTRAGTLDVAKRIIAAGGTFKLVHTRAAGTSLCTVLLHVIFRA